MSPLACQGGNGLIGYGYLHRARSIGSEIFRRTCTVTSGSRINYQHHGRNFSETIAKLEEEDIPETTSEHVLAVDAS